MFDENRLSKIRNEIAELADVKHPGHHLFYEFHSNESADPSTILFHAFGAWRITDGLHDVLWNPRFVMAGKVSCLKCSCAILARPVVLQTPKKGGVVAWHQDYSYWTRTKPIAHLTCWCGLDDSTIENGCLQYVPGSQRWGLPTSLNSRVI